MFFSCFFLGFGFVVCFFCLLWFCFFLFFYFFCQTLYSLCCWTHNTRCYKQYAKKLRRLLHRWSMPRPLACCVYLRQCCHSHWRRSRMPRKPDTHRALLLLRSKKSGGKYLHEWSNKRNKKSGCRKTYSQPCSFGKISEIFCETYTTHPNGPGREEVSQRQEKTCNQNSSHLRRCDSRSLPAEPKLSQGSGFAGHGQRPVVLG